MQLFRVISLLTALSLSGLTSICAQAQAGGPVEPSSTAVEINDAPTKSSSGSTAGTSSPGSMKTSGASSTTEKPASPAKSDEAVAEASDARMVAKSTTLNAGDKVDTLVVRNRTLTIAGVVTHDVIAVDSDVILEPSARIGGRLIVTNGSIVDKGNIAGSIKILQPELFQHQKILLEDNGTLLQIPAITAEHAVVSESHNRNDWFGGQLALLLIGLVGGLIALVIAPRATGQCSGFLGLEPARALLIGLLASLIVVPALFVNAALLNSPLRLFYAPLGFLVIAIPLITLAYGWLCGMRRVGDWLAVRAGKREVGGLYSRIALGLGCFFFVNILMGRINGILGGATLLVEFVIALMGMGAVIATGFGRDPDWLGARLRGDAAWFSFGRR